MADVDSVDYLQARNLYYQEKWDESRLLFKRALDNFSNENNTHPGVAATQLKIASIDIKKGDIKEAM